MRQQLFDEAHEYMVNGLDTPFFARRYDPFFLWLSDTSLSMFTEHSSFSFLRFLDTSPSDVHKIHISPLIRRRLMALDDEASVAEHEPYSL